MEVNHKAVIKALAYLSSYNGWSQMLRKIREYLVSQIEQHHKSIVV